MIVGTFIRNYKVYKGINYIPITTGDTFAAFIGENGVGKSSVLEALDSFFNSATWIPHVEAKEKGFSRREPYIAPVFLIHKSELKASNAAEKQIIDKINKISDVIWGVKLSDFNQSQIEEAKAFLSHRERLSQRHDRDNYYLLAIGYDYKGDATLSILGSIERLKELLMDEFESVEDAIGAIWQFFDKRYTYIYIPADVDAVKYTMLENKNIQELMGEDINDVINNVITDQQIREINTGLNKFIDEVGEKLISYKYKKPAKKQRNLTRSDINSRVLESFFSIRVLNKKNGSSEIPVAQLSSGEKRKALLDVAHSFLGENKKTKKKIIFAVDEPEASLHTSACFDQFEKLLHIADFGYQVLATTHWYGFIPAIAHGVANLTEKSSKDEVTISMIELSSYRESIKKKTKETKGQFPSDICLKSMNDLVQSIMSSIRRVNPYYWIICEGSSEKIYFEHFFSNEIKKGNLRILPVGGAKEVKRIYQYLQLPVEEDKKVIKGRIFCLIDTDKELIKFDASDSNEMIVRRLLNVGDKTQLVKVNDVKSSPPTEIEDALHGGIFRRTLLYFAAEDAGLKDALANTKNNFDKNKPSFQAFDWRQSDYNNLSAFLDKNDGSNKLRVACKYVELADRSSVMPKWVDEIKAFLYGPGFNS